MTLLFWIPAILANVVLVGAVVRVVVNDRKLRRERDRLEQQEQYEVCRRWIEFR
jgi:hypothetical protein